MLAGLQVEVDAEGDLDWPVSVDSTISRVPQHGAADLVAYSGLGGMTSIRGCGETIQTTGRSGDLVAG